MAIYVYFFKSSDEDGLVKEHVEDVTAKFADESVESARQILSDFLSQTDESYVDKFGMVHEVYNGLDQIYAYIFDVPYDDWSAVTGETGFWLDDENNKDMPENVRQCFQKVYDYALSMS